MKVIIDGFGAEKHLPCLAHILNLVPSKLIESDEMINPIHIKVKEIVTHFKKSIPSSDALRAVTSHKLTQSVDTRWNSAYEMYEEFIELFDVIAPILLKNVSAPEMLSANELQVITEFEKLLKPFKKATDIVNGEAYVTGRQAIPIIKNLKERLNSSIVNTDVRRYMKRKLTTEFTQRFEHIKKMTLVATSTLLDPRFKRLYFSDALACSQATNKNSTSLHDRISETLTESCENASSNSQKQSLEKDGFWSHHNILVQQNKSFQALNQNRNEMPEELRYYLKEPVIDYDQNPLKFWNRYDSALSKIAMRYFTVIATSVPSEGLFSQATLILTEKRNRLTAEHFQQLLFLTCLSLADWNL
ncbi:zinc finger bed domain-containing protein 1-like protein [Lasius niger]|uniref:Zinc finger bed domain-containing protein 1-like protein n=1 Tax=Lasius niger TaxID=67767 RepID=A0A0J7K4D3_LASNI|nr:zinc finger bed domain-containing protein 1-like protein [Lasius niger]